MYDFFFHFSNEIHNILSTKQKNIFQPALRKLDLFNNHFLGDSYPVAYPELSLGTPVLKASSKHEKRITAGGKNKHA